MTNEVQSKKLHSEDPVETRYPLPCAHTCVAHSEQVQDDLQAFYTYSDPNSWTICYRDLFAKQFATTTS